MRMNYALFISVLAIGAAVLICGCMGLPGDGDRNQTNETPVGENLTVGEVLARDATSRCLSGRSMPPDVGGGRSPDRGGPTPSSRRRTRRSAGSRRPRWQNSSTTRRHPRRDPALPHGPPGRYTAAGIAANDTVPTVQGSPIAVDAAGESVTVNGARIVRRDIPAANGVIHAIDAVMIPPDVILLPADETVANVTENETAVNVTENVTG